MTDVVASGFRIQICQRRIQIVEFEVVAHDLQSRRLAVAGTQRELCFGSHEKTAELDGPCRGRRAPWAMDCFSQQSHEFMITHRLRRGHIEHALHLWRADGQQRDVAQVVNVNPTVILATIADTATHAEPGESCEGWQCAAALAKDEADAQDDFADGVIGQGVNDGLFPCGGYFWRKPATDVCSLGEPLVATAAIDRQRGSLDRCTIWSLKQNSFQVPHSVPKGIMQDGLTSRVVMG